MNRRSFLKRSTFAAAAFGAPTIVPSTIFGQNAPSNRIEVGFIGIGRQGFNANLPQMMAVPGVQVTTVCDVDSWRMEEAAKAVDAFYATQTGRSSHKSCVKRSDFRELIADKSIDALMISTPDHWHSKIAIEAMTKRFPSAVYKKPYRCATCKAWHVTSTPPRRGRRIQR